MSASLVGSEMCIRDRWSPSQRPTSAHSSCGAWQGRSWPWFAGPRTWATSVSYTHLTLPTICSV
eukprot:11879319-Alexandrium_andersonii.AAC.1